jgi:hypothetical protein
MGAAAAADAAAYPGAPVRDSGGGCHISPETSFANSVGTAENHGVADMGCRGSTLIDAAVYARRLWPSKMEGCVESSRKTSAERVLVCEAYSLGGVWIFTPQKYRGLREKHQHYYCL